jgi:glycosyltransferase involved in cell wall biosynthesis
MARWRIVVHALDRTGPPVLARTLVRWWRRHRPEDELDVVAVRGGPLLDDLVREVPVRVLLRPSEPWDVEALDPTRTRALAGRLADAPTPDATLLVSVAAAQALPLLPPGPVVTWSVEQGEDLHWVDRPVGLRDRTTRWLAGSEVTRAELRDRLGALDVGLAPEFVEDPGTVDAVLVARCRTALGATDDELLVVGAGIATPRKGPDLFLEVALAHRRSNHGRARFVWIGGEHDVLHWPVRDERLRLGLDELEVVESVGDLVPWLAAADVFLHTARLDAFPLVCLHAALAGTPVACFSGTGGTTEMFGEDLHGAPYPDVAGLAAAVADLADPRLRAEVSAAQAARVRAGHTVDVAAPAVEAELLAVAGVTLDG